jgi:hypothetical protein
MRKLRTDIEIPYAKITGICPVDRRDTEYLKRSDIDAFLNDYYQLLSICVFAPQCDAYHENVLISQLAASSGALMDDASEVSQRGLRLRAWYAVKHFW